MGGSIFSDWWTAELRWLDTASDAAIALACLAVFVAGGVAIRRGGAGFPRRPAIALLGFVAACALSQASSLRTTWFTPEAAALLKPIFAFAVISAAIATIALLRSAEDRSRSDSGRSAGGAPEFRLNDALAAIIRHMSQGIVLYDTDMRIVLSNTQYNALLGLPQTLTSPGGKLEDSARFLAQRGEFGGGDIEAVVKERMARQAESTSPQRYSHKMLNGTVLDVVRVAIPGFGYATSYTDITELTRAQDDLRAAVARQEQRERELQRRNGILDAVIGNVSQGIALYDSDLRIIVCNRQWQRLMKVPDQLARPGVHVEEIFRYLASRGDNGAENLETRIAQATEGVRQLIHSGSVERYQMNRKQEGVVLDISRAAVPGFGYIATCADITDQVNAQDELRDLAETLERRVQETTALSREIESREHELQQRNRILDTVISSMSQGMALYDKDMRIILDNRQFQVMMGLPDHITRTGAHVEEMFRYFGERGDFGMENVDEAVREAVEGARRLVLSPVPLTQSYQLRKRHDGRVLHVIRASVPDVGYIGTCTDITELANIQDELRNLAATLELRVQERTEELSREVIERRNAQGAAEARARALETTNKELEQFSFVASHDLQEPLRKIQAFGDMLMMRHGEKLGQDGAGLIDRMQKAAERMSTLIKGLLAFSRLATRGDPMVRTDLRLVLDGVLQDLEIAIQESRAQIQIGDLPVLEADALQLRQLFQNLIGNALKFRKPGTPPVIQVQSRAMSVPESGFSEMWEIEVRDNGIGFDQQYKMRIFEVFQRLNNAVTYPGSGIGLTICRKVVERHHGHIEASSTEGEGAVFYIRLPSRQPEDGSARNSPIADQGQAAIR